MYENLGGRGARRGLLYPPLPMLMPVTAISGGMVSINRRKSAALIDICNFQE